MFTTPNLNNQSERRSRAADDAAKQWKAHVTWQGHKNLTSSSWWRRETCWSSTFIQACFTFCLSLLAPHSSFYILCRWIMYESSFRLPSHDARTQPCSLFIQHESMLNVFKMHQSRQLWTCSLCKIDRINGSEDLRLTDVFLTVSLGFYEQTSHDQRRFWQTFCWFSCISAWL